MGDPRGHPGRGKFQKCSGDTLAEYSPPFPSRGRCRRCWRSCGDLSARVVRMDVLGVAVGHPGRVEERLRIFESLEEAIPVVRLTAAYRHHKASGMPRQVENVHQIVVRPFERV